MNIVKRVFNFKKLFALVMTIVMLSTLSVAGFTRAIEEDDWICVDPLRACYDTGTNNLIITEEGRVVNLSNENLFTRDDSLCAELLDINGRVLRQFRLQNETISLDINKYPFGLISFGGEFYRFLQSFSNLETTQALAALKLNVYVVIENIKKEIVGEFKVADIILDITMNRKRTEIPAAHDFEANSCCSDDSNIVFHDKRARH